MLSIITINRNNGAGLEKTLRSITAQSLCDFEHIIIDGASDDDSVGIIRKYSESAGHHVRWLSEPDSGIYNAINKGIRMAAGDYIQILNSGDCLASDDVIERMMLALEENDCPGILYGNMLRVSADGLVTGRSGEVDCSLLEFYTGTLNHDCAWIRRSLFDQYGFYDESLGIVSDWKWYLQTIGLGKVHPVYADIDVSLFDTGGISETNPGLGNRERRKVLEDCIPPAVLFDYDRHAFEMNQMDRLRRHHLYGLVYFIERVLFKLEKWHVLHTGR